MKLTLALVSALAATASAFPVRIIALSAPPQYLPVDGVQPLSEYPESVHGSAAPCQGHIERAREGLTVPSGPIGALMARLGITSPDARPLPHPHHGPHADDDKWAVLSATHDEGDSHRVIEAWKHRMEDMFRSAGDRVLPIMQGGSVRILPVDMNHQFAHGPGHHGNAHPGWKSLEGSNGVRKHHHHGQGYTPDGPRSFMCRLGRALRSLNPTETTALMFVLGAGIGSLFHLVFAMIFITVRMLRGKRGSCSARRAARREARRLRKEERRARKAGGIRLEGEENEEVLPSYAEGETDRLVEKA